MTVIRLGLRWAVFGLVACAAIGCASQPREGEDSGVVLFGAVADIYTVCIHLSSDATRLEPSVVCDPEGVTPYSFNIEVEEGTDGDGDPCGPFEFQDDGVTELRPNGMFELSRTFMPAQNATVTDSVTATLASGGSVETGEGVGIAVREVSIEVGGEDIRTTCQVDWVASTTPVCFEEAAERCNLLLTCCESIYLLPPILENCLQVVTECNPDTCEEVLAGYIQCPQPPICTDDEDPDGFCIALNDCCNNADLSKAELVECLDTAEACEPAACQNLLAMYPVDMYPECPPPPDMSSSE